MSGSVLKVAVAHRPPFVFVGNGTGGQPVFYGLLIDLFHKILATIKDPIEYDFYVSGTNGGGALKKGNWTGIVGELVAGRADVALFPLTRTTARLEAIDVSYAYLSQGLGILIRSDEAGPGALSVLFPFAMTLWVTLLCTVIGVALLFWALDVYGKWIRSKQLAALRASGVLSEKAMARAKKDDGNPVLISFMAAAGAPERPGRASWGVQVLYVVYCFFCFIILSAYTANLTSFWAVRRSDVSVKSLQDLANLGAPIGINPNGSTHTYFTNSKDTLATQLKPNIKFCEPGECEEWVRTGKVKAFISDAPALAYSAQQSPCDMALVAKGFGPDSLVIGFPKDSALLQLFNRAIQGFSEDGTLTSLQREWFDNRSQCRDTDLRQSAQLTVGQTLGAFMFLLIGILVAFITGTVENLKWCLARAYVRSATDAGTQPSRCPSGSRNGDKSVHVGSGREPARLINVNWRRISSGLIALTQRSLHVDDLEANDREPSSLEERQTALTAPRLQSLSGVLPELGSRPTLSPPSTPQQQQQQQQQQPPRPQQQQQPQQQQRRQQGTPNAAPPLLQAARSYPLRCSSRSRSPHLEICSPAAGDAVLRVHQGHPPSGNTSRGWSLSGADEGGPSPLSACLLLPMAPSIGAPNTPGLGRSSDVAVRRSSGAPANVEAPCLDEPSFGIARRSSGALVSGAELSEEVVLEELVLRPEDAWDCDQVPYHVVQSIAVLISTMRAAGSAGLSWHGNVFLKAAVRQYDAVILELTRPLAPGVLAADGSDCSAFHTSTTMTEGAADALARLRDAIVVPLLAEVEELERYLRGILAELALAVELRTQSARQRRQQQLYDKHQRVSQLYTLITALDGYCGHLERQLGSLFTQDMRKGHGMLKQRLQSLPQPVARPGPEVEVPSAEHLQHDNVTSTLARMLRSLIATAVRLAVWADPGPPTTATAT